MTLCSYETKTDKILCGCNVEIYFICSNPSTWRVETYRTNDDTRMANSRDGRVKRRVFTTPLLFYYLQRFFFYFIVIFFKAYYGDDDTVRRSYMSMSIGYLNVCSDTRATPLHILLFRVRVATMVIKQTTTAIIIKIADTFGKCASILNLSTIGGR